jgi:hypothetical protein
MNKQQPSLIFCIIMDIIGYASFAIPGLAEISDIIWAPISAFIFFKAFGGWKGAFGGVFNFVEEILPFTDFIPTFTIMWVWQYFSKRQQVPSVTNSRMLLK